ncbi:MAG TPA: aspartyl/asparaginyl beta-hydroxylase domain-containing protein [Thermoanaerobaculia bacterium]|nr:aspartyl/asparaginyl beta-hydroxylase domain-containing protein [Thermoanaerobaculia bacterium]
MESQFDWNSSYAVPSRVRFRLTPSGSLQAGAGDDGAGEALELPTRQVALLLLFAHAHTAEQAYEHAAARWNVEREIFRRLLEAWISKGLLRASVTSPETTSRHAMFARAIEEYSSGPPRPFPLLSPFELQRPTLYYPGLATREIHDPRAFPWVATLEASFPLIQQEFTALLAGADFARVNRSYTSTGEWAAAYLWVFGAVVEETCRLCPETARLLRAIPGVAEFGTTLFSALAPHSYIAPHCGYTNAKLRCQLPLQVPRGCKLRVGDHEIEQVVGRCIVFDDSFLHAAWNESDEPRFVIVFDFFHPDLTSDEIQYLSILAREKKIAKPYLDQAAAGKKAAWVKASSDDGPTQGEAKLERPEPLAGMLQ